MDDPANEELGGLDDIVRAAVRESPDPPRPSSLRTLLRASYGSLTGKSMVGLALLGGVPLTVIGVLGSREEAADPSTIDPQIWTWFFRDVKKNAPKFIVDTAPAGVRSSERTPMKKYPRLERYLQKNYRFDRTIDGYDLYVRT